MNHCIPASLHLILDTLIKGNVSLSQRLGFSQNFPSMKLRSIPYGLKSQREVLTCNSVKVISCMFETLGIILVKDIIIMSFSFKSFAILVLFLDGPGVAFSLMEQYWQVKAENLNSMRLPCLPPAVNNDTPIWWPGTTNYCKTGTFLDMKNSRIWGSGNSHAWNFRQFLVPVIFVCMKFLRISRYLQKIHARENLLFYSIFFWWVNRKLHILMLCTSFMYQQLQSTFCPITVHSKKFSGIDIKW